MITRKELILEEAKKDHLDFLDACLEAYGRAIVEGFIDYSSDIDTYDKSMKKNAENFLKELK